MRFLSFRIDNQHSFGALIENRVVDLGRRMSGYQNLREVIAAGALVRAKDIAAESSADYELDEVELTSPVTDPGKVICIDAGSANAADVSSEHPGIYLRSSESLVGHHQPLVVPLESESLDYRSALALIVGSGGRRITEKAARSTIAGITLANDTTVRDCPVPGHQNVTLARNVPETGSIGPWLVTLDDISDFDEFLISTRINQGDRQQSSSAQLPFSLSYLICYLSRFVLLNAGDVILIALPLLSAAQRSDIPLLPGDQVMIENTDIGSLGNRVVAEVETNDAD